MQAQIGQADLGLFIIVAAMVGIAAIIAIIIFRKKKRMRREEFRQHIKSITDPNGCAWAEQLYLECCLLSKWYGFSPEKDGGFRGDFMDLRKAVEASIAQYTARVRESEVP